MRSSSKRRGHIRLAAATSAVALMVAACSSGDGQEGGEETPSGPVELTMTVWSANEGHHAIFNQIADSYIEANPDKVSAVEFMALPGGTYVNALTTQIAGGQSPDIAWMLETSATEFVEAGVFTNLTPVFSETEGYEFDDLIPGALGRWSKDGDLYAYPFSNSPFGIYVNSDLLQAAGQPDPRELIASGDWTWDRLMEIAAATAESQGVAGFQPGGTANTQWNGALSPLWLSWGAAPWDEAGTTCTMTDPEMVDFFTWYHSNVYETGAIVEPGEEFDFASGQVAARMALLSASGGLGDTFEWDFLPLPEGPAGAVPVVGQAGVGVLSQGDHPEVAADFLAHFTNPENSRLLAQYFPPPRVSLLTLDVLSEAAPALNEEQIQSTIVEQAATGVAPPGNAKMSTIDDPVRAALDAVWNADADVEGALTAACEAMDSRLAG